jgi:hypothetical protein
LREAIEINHKGRRPLGDRSFSKFTFEDYGPGRAVSRPRTHTYTPLGERTFYNFKSMDGTVLRFGAHALRLSSEVVRDTEGLWARVRRNVPWPTHRRHKVETSSPRWTSLSQA